jgi:CBS-domain-containing membrane protein
MKASDIMAPHVITVGPELDVKAVANTLVTNGISAVPVLDTNNRIIGIVSEGDLMRRVVLGKERKRSWWFDILSSPDQQWAEFAKVHGRKAKDVMTRQVITVDPDTSLQQIALLLEEHGIKRVPVVKNGELVGMVSRANLVQALAIRGLPFFDREEADETLRETVMSKIHRLPWTGSMVDVIVDHGVVNLWGRVRTEEEKNGFRVAAEEVPGVRKVNNYLKVLFES